MKLFLRMMVLVAALATLFVWPWAAAQQKQKGERELLLQLDHDFDAATAEKGIEGWLSYFAENGSMLPPAGPPVTGPEAIRKTMGLALADPHFPLRWQPRRAEILVPGVLGYTLGRYSQKRKRPDGKTLLEQGTYFTLWRKQQDGSWKIVLDTGSPDGPPRPLE